MASKSAGSRPPLRKTPGDLRMAILETSLVLIDKKGVAGLSMREVARRLGVTHQAPYHHFEGRGAIVRAIVDEGFAKLGTALTRAVRPEQSALENYTATGHAYVRFALTHSAYFRLMFRPELVPPRTVPKGEDKSNAPDSFAVLVDCVRALQREGHVAAGDPMETVLLSWAAVHGIASLTLDGPARNQPGFPKETAVVDALSALLARPLR